MMYALKKKKFNVYRVSNCPYAFVNNLSFYDGKQKEKTVTDLHEHYPQKIVSSMQIVDIQNQSMNMIIGLIKYFHQCLKSFKNVLEMIQHIK